MLAKDVMTEGVITVHPKETIKDVARILSENEISGLPVVDDNEKLVGVVSEQDLIVRDKKLHFPDYIYLLDSVIYLESLKNFEEEFTKMIGTRVEDIMSKEAITVDSDISIEEIATIMVEEGINRVPVLDGEKLVGIVSRADLVDVLAKEGGK
ncbi:CBS domain-containing protein [Selenihalanaerobacter shriftii]|uniref:CBS domain-containing protein n=1 Tax=Selenihalanaerobacter shriftii TaxID=142842 RepID=A0A1T4JWG7_9FIRM|nr:CBS domain-containing protein [Selenihalanaerobacter shriftii]SJZ34469.1 CBS domain-containing protein [Selenihalanaerobacter shriftii]